MPAYQYRAVHASGRIAQGSISAINEQELAQHLGHAGLELIQARVKKEVVKKLRRPSGLSSRMLAVFCAQMLDLLQAGVPFIDALQNVAGTADNKSLRDILGDMIRAIHNGRSIGSVFGFYPRVFPPVFTAILAAGEKSGDLAVTFAHLTRYAEHRARTSEQLRRALRYPFFLMLVAFGVVTFMMSMVVPQIVQFLNSIDSDLPLMTRILIRISNAFADAWWVLALGFVGIFAVLAFLRRHSATMALKLDASLLRMPLLGIVIRKLALSRFMQSVAILFQSGLGLPVSLRSARNTLGNHALIQVLDDAEQQIQSGQPLSVAMRTLLPSFALRMIRTGEQSGKLDKSLQDVATAYDREVADVTERLIGALEPALTLMIGGVLAWVVLAVLGPLYGNLAKLSGMH